MHAEQTVLVHGRIIDAQTDAPLVAAVIRLERVGLFRQESYIATSGMDGVFRFESIAPGRYKLRAELTGYAKRSYGTIRVSAEKQQSIALELEKVRVQLACDTCQQAPLLLGKVYDSETDQPINSAQIHIPEAGVTVVSADEGVFSLSTGEGEYTILTKHSSYFTDTSRARLAPGSVTNVRIGLRPLVPASAKTGTLTGTIIDTTAAQGVSGATVSLLNTEYSTLSADDGYYELTGVEPGSYSIMVAKWGYETEVLSGVIIRAKETTYSNCILHARETGILSPDAPGYITGIITSPDGDPFENAIVLVKETGDWAMSDYQGRFRVDSIAEGVYTLIATAEEFDTTMLPQVDVWNGEETVIDIQLRDAIALHPDILEVAADEAVIAGLVVDAEKNAGMAGVSVSTANGKAEAVTDLNGRYALKVKKAGTYGIIADHANYVQEQPGSVTVDLGRKATLDIILSKSDVTEMQRLTVRSVAVKNTDAALLKQRQEAFSVSDAIGADQISQSGAGNAADAMRFVTGASVVDGKYIFIRGLGDRYTSTLLNGTEIPSTDPLKRAGSIDIVPSELVDNIVTLKTFTPDRPGNFAGGAVDIQTKEIPEKSHFTISLKGAYNLQANLREQTILYKGSSTDWLGFDDGARDLPGIFQDESFTPPDKITARSNNDSAFILDKATRSFSDRIAPREQKFPLDFGISSSAGKKFDFNGRPLGIMGSFTYENTYDAYDSGTLTRWQRGSVDQDSLNFEYDFVDVWSGNSVFWGGLIASDFEYYDKQRLLLTGIYNQNGIKEARRLQGPYPYDLGEDDTYHTSVLGYTQRTLGSVQLQLLNTLPLRNLETTVRLNHSFNRQYQPDLSYFTYYSRYNWNDSLVYGIKQNVPPARYWRTLNENNSEIALDLKMPLFDYSDLESSAKTGGVVTKKKRDYSERLFIFSQDPKYGADMEGGGFNGAPEDLFSDPNIGVDIDTGGYNDYKLHVLESNTPAATYQGTLNVFAGYALTEWKFNNRYGISGGYRLERTIMSLATEDSTKNKGHIENNDHLWSLNLSYSPIENMNCRFVTSRTISRPRFREIAEFASVDFIGGNTFVGNADLNMTRINNFDLRWEWFTKPGELLSISGFYKEFINPIQNYIQDVNYLIKPDNVGNAIVYGLEFELRQGLDILTEFGLFERAKSSLSNFKVGGNFSFINSRVDIPEKEINLKREFFNANDTTSLAELGVDEQRPFAGQSDGLFNLYLLYANPEAGITSSIFYNYFGERLSDISLQGTPDVYEQPRPLLNFKFTYSVNANLSTTFSAKNLLDKDKKDIMYYRDDEYICASSDKGRSFSLGVKYAF